MHFYTLPTKSVIKNLGTDERIGLSVRAVEQNRIKYGSNVLTKNKKQSLISRVFSALKEPMLIILLFGFVLALGVNLGKFFKTGEGDFGECVGILVAVILSVAITLIMEGSSEKAFSMLNKIYDNVTVKVIREGRILTVSQQNVVVGDIVILESGQKIIADGRLIESVSLLVEEAALTGESHSVEKKSGEIYPQNTPLAERKNMVYSGTFVTAGEGKMVVTAVGDKTEIGSIAGELNGKNSGDTPLQHKLNKLGKTITIIGACCAVLVFGLSILKLALSGGVSFENVQELFVSCIILIVAAVPEGLPTIVAVSLALNMIKLAKENALIKKMTATETAGAVSVICSDKTGTLTQNKMTVVSVCTNEFCVTPEKLSVERLHQNFVCNSTADVTVERKGKYVFNGNATECALIVAYMKNNSKLSYKEFRRNYQVVEKQPFSSDNKLMSTTIKIPEGYRKLVKGAPEVILDLCSLTKGQKEKIIYSMQKHQKKAHRVLCFAHRDSNDLISEGNLTYDGFVAITDPLRPEVKRAVKDCERAGIKVKMLTGDNMETAFAIAKELGIADEQSAVVNGYEIESLDDVALKKIIPKISVIARSTPLIKLRVVRALKELGEVVAVTGDGINDAPAIKHADVGFAMGETGTEISKEVADVVLLDDSFNSVVKAISFGRNVYRNLQRFILFQLSVNLSALFFITVCAILGLPTPFNTLQLLWVNIIMDGPPALTLGLEGTDKDSMKQKPVKKSDGIVSAKMFLRIAFNGIFIGVTMVAQYIFNFLCVGEGERSSAVFTLFILFQLFNAFNSRELGSESILKGIGKNKVMVITFVSVFLVHLFIVQVAPGLFGVSSLSFVSWMKCIFTSLSIVVVSEIYKLVYRKLKVNNKISISLISLKKRFKKVGENK